MNHIGKNWKIVKKEFPTGFIPLEKDVKGNNNMQKHLEESSRDKRGSLTGFTGLKETG